MNDEGQLLGPSKTMGGTHVFELSLRKHKHVIGVIFVVSSKSMV